MRFRNTYRSGSGAENGLQRAFEMPDEQSGEVSGTCEKKRGAGGPCMENGNGAVVWSAHMLWNRPEALCCDAVL